MKSYSTATPCGLRFPPLSYGLGGGPLTVTLLHGRPLWVFVPPTGIEPAQAGVKAQLPSQHSTGASGVTDGTQTRFN